jgi:L-ascorbate metabolism protein UlaG (beta-lactamase superfamily)
VDPLGRARARAAGAVDAVLVTHAHVDHLNRWTLKIIDRAVPLVVPKGAGAIVADLGFAKVTEVEPGDHVPLQGIDVIAVPTRHDQGRWKKGDTTSCAGYVISAGGAAIHHSGDVDFSDHAVFDELGARFRLDATLLPIGGMLPVSWYQRRRERLDRGVHIDPDAALAIAERLGARAMVPVHWGTVSIAGAAPKKRLVQVAAERGLDRLVRVLEHGATLSSEMVLDGAEDADRRAAQADDRSEDLVADGGVGGIALERTP